MNLESLANELLLDIFEYLPTVQLLRSFHRLNTRLNDLIFTHFRTHCLDLRTSSKHDFDTVCQVNLPVLTSCIGSLGLSDDDDNPHQIDVFHSHQWRLHRFEHLHSLSLDHVRSGERISDMLNECPQLTRLRVTACYFGRKQDDIQCFVETIWSLPKLIHCHLDIDMKHGFSFPTPTRVSMSIEHLSNVGVPCRIGQLVRLCNQTPRLRSISLDLYHLQDTGQLVVPIPSITELNLVFVGPHQGIVENLLKCVPNLNRLKIETCYVDMDGHDWEQIIRNDLPELNRFELKMRFQATGENYRKGLFSSFRTRFWLEERRWFVQYHANPDDSSNMICLYTLPYRFSYMDLLLPIVLHSTAPHNTNEDDDLSFDHVQHLCYRSSLADGTVTSGLRFPKLTHLSVTLPVQKHLLKLIEEMPHLSLLEVSRPNSIAESDAQSQLQALLDHAPHLKSLKFSSWKDTRLTASTATERTPNLLQTLPIQRVNLLGYDHWFNRDDCAQLCVSSLGAHCEVLLIKVENRTNILDLIHSMPRLRSLVARSNDDTWTNYSSSPADHLVQWLQQNLPQTCSIQRDARFVHHVRLWI